jgi:hypothetical protein
VQALSPQRLTATPGVSRSFTITLSFWSSSRPASATCRISVVVTVLLWAQSGGATLSKPTNSSPTSVQFAPCPRARLRSSQAALPALLESLDRMRTALHLSTRPQNGQVEWPGTRPFLQPSLYSGCHGQTPSLHLAAATATATPRISTGTTAARTAEVDLPLQYLADRFLRRGFRSN